MNNMKITKRALISSVLATLLCFAMLVGTTFAWFTDSVTSSGNIIQTGTLKVGLYWANGAEAVPTTDDGWTDATSGAIFKGDQLWEPGYTDAKHIKIANVGNLALNYQLRIVANGAVGKLADVIDVYYFKDTTAAITRADIANAVDADVATESDNIIRIGTLTEVLGTKKNLSKFVKGEKLLPKEEVTLSLALVMQTTADDKYQNMDLGCEFSVELTATQASYEEDSFGPDYDLNSPDSSEPTALVRVLDDLKINSTLGLGGTPSNITLDVGYKFEPTMGRPAENGFIDLSEHLTYDPENSVESSEYRWWHADFVVSADNPIPANSLALAGYYSAFCDGFNNGNWVAITNDGLDVAAGQEIRLVESLASLMGGSVTVSWNDLCLYGNDGKGFMCGLDALDAVALAGTTITVELCMFPTECDNPGCHHDNYACENGDPITIGTFTYTFPHVVDSADGLKAAIAAGATEIILSDDIDMNGEAVVIPENTTTVIDLNGYTLTSKDGGTGNWMAIEVDNGATLTLEDSSEAGTGKVVSSCYGVYVQPGATFIMNGGSLEVSGNGQYDMGVLLWNGAFVMNAGSINAQGAVVADNYWKNKGDTDVLCSVKIAEGCVLESNGYADVEITNAPDTIVNVPESVWVWDWNNQG